MTDIVQEKLLPASLFFGQNFIVRYRDTLYGVPSVAQLGRMDDSGEMIITRAMEAIKEKILSLHHDHFRAHISSVDIQESCIDGMKVLVTGYMVGSDKLIRNFAQTFFLAPKEGGYFILNDIFNFVEKGSSPVIENDGEVVPLVNVEKIPLAEVDTEEVPLAEVIDEEDDDYCIVDAKEFLFIEVDDDEVSDDYCIDDTKEVPLVKVIKEVCHDSFVTNENNVPLAKVIAEGLVDSCAVDAKKIPLAKVNEDEPPLVCNADTKGECMPSSSSIRGWLNTHKKEPYLLVEIPKGDRETFDKLENAQYCVVKTKEVSLAKVVDQVHEDSHKVEPKEVPFAKTFDEVLDHSLTVEAEIKIEEGLQKYHASPFHKEDVATLPTTNGIVLPSILEEKADDDCSIYIKCLPLTVTPSILEEKFKRFGPIKNGGIQVAVNKQRFCYGFVEFMEANSVQKALEASPVEILGRQIVVEEKQPSIPIGRRGAHRYRDCLPENHNFNKERTRKEEWEIGQDYDPFFNSNWNFRYGSVMRPPY